MKLSISLYSSDFTMSSTRLCLVFSQTYYTEKLKSTSQLYIHLSHRSHLFHWA